MLRLLAATFCALVAKAMIRHLVLSVVCGYNRQLPNCSSGQYLVACKYVFLQKSNRDAV